jgi:hypothetical protein
MRAKVALAIYTHIYILLGHLCFCFGIYEREKRFSLDEVNNGGGILLFFFSKVSWVISHEHSSFVLLDPKQHTPNVQNVE